MRPSADGNLAVLDARDESTTSLTGLGRALPRQGNADRAGAYWLSTLAATR